MKIVLTEEQMKMLIREEINEENLIQSLLGKASKSAIGKDILAALVAGIISFSSVPFILTRLAKENPTVESIATNSFLDKLEKAWDKVKDKESQITSKMQSDASTSPGFQEKVDALRRYMEISAKNQNYNPKDILISPEAMIKACEQTGFDLPLLIAQAHLESCFGLTPRARRTNSVFSVGSYDNGKDAVTYPTQDDSILPYIKLVQNNYLPNKTVEDLLEPGGFVNTKNLRYASDKSYENKVKIIRNRIKTKYPVLVS